MEAGVFSQQCSCGMKKKETTKCKKMFAAIYSPIPFLFENDFLLIDSVVTEQFSCVGQKFVHLL